MRGLKMSRFARLALAAAAFAAVQATPAHATRLVLPENLTTSHFKVHFHGNPASPATPVTRQQAGDLAGAMERAYTTITSTWGYPAPLDDGDGKVDVYVTDLTPSKINGAAFADTSANQTSGYLHIDDDATELQDVTMHELFHLVQFGIWSPAEGWLEEATAEWAAFRFVGFPATLKDAAGKDYTLLSTLGAPDMSLNCSGDACGLTSYERKGYSRWYFFQYLTERFGNATVKEIFDKGKALNDATRPSIDFISELMLAKGTTLANVFGDWTVANMSGGYTTESLKVIVPVAWTTTFAGLKTGALPTKSVEVNHLAARYLAFQRGDGASSGTCYAATLTLTVTMPSGLGALPTFRWTAPGGVATPLAISGSTATLSLPWDTCSWSYSGLLSLPNPSTATDAALFTVTASLSVDTKTIVTPTAPPPGTYTGPTIPAPLTDEPPAIALYGPEVVRVSKRTRTLRLIVFSSGAGKLEAKLGGALLGSRTLRGGNNDLRFTLPRSFLRSLSARGTLTLTSLSPSGKPGATIKRKITLTK